MQQESLLEDFRKEWETFLIERGHQVRNPKGIGCVLVSRNSEKKTYRWLLLLARGKSRKLHREELEDLGFHLKRARKLNQNTYVVIGFRKPQRKLMVLPASKVLKTSRVFPTKGGIPWDE